MGALRLDCALAIPVGVTGLVGASGAGKTTLLRCLAGLRRLPGSVRVEGEVWQDDRVFLPAHRRAVGYVFQEPSLLPHLTVRGNLDYALRRARAGGPGLDAIVAVLGLEALLSRATERLSGGERQRVAIGRALLAAPRLLLMDEPLSSLDPQGKAEILPYLRRLPDLLAAPILWVSHDPGEIASLARGILRMRDGRLESVAPGAAADPRLAGLEESEIRRLAGRALDAGLG